MINIASIIHNDGINGPGLRCTVFVQGCKRKCVGCHSQHTWEFGTGVDDSADDLIDECRKNPLDTGITFTGGDPIYQYKELLPVVNKLRQRYNLWLYTGATIDELKYKSRHDTDLHEFLKAFNCIVAEPFILEKRDVTLKYRGSTNQRMYRIYTDSVGIDYFKDITSTIERM